MGDNCELKSNDIINLCYKVDDKFKNKYKAGSKIKNAKVIVLGGTYEQRISIHNEFIGMPLLPKTKNNATIIQTQHIEGNGKKKYIELDSKIKGTFSLKQTQNLSNILNKNQNEDINLYMHGLKNHCICYINLAEKSETELQKILKDYDCNYSSLFVVLVNNNQNIINMDLLKIVQAHVAHSNIITLFVGVENIEDITEIKQHLNKNNDPDQQIIHYAVKSDKCIDTIPAYNEVSQYTGLANLEKHIINIFIQKYIKALPNIINNINQYVKELEGTKKTIGVEIPKDKTEQMILINSLINNVSHEFITSIHNVNIQYNYGYAIQEIFSNLKTELTELQFSNSLNIEYVKNVKELCTTNSLFANMTTLKLVDFAVNDKKLNIFDSIQNMCIMHIDKVCKIIENMILDILNNNEISVYPNLIALINKKVAKDLNEYKKIILLKMAEYITCEQGFTWSTDNEFLTKCAIVDDTDENILNNINIYLSSIKNTMALFVPKLIVQCIVRKAEKNIFSDLSSSIIYGNENVLEQDDNVQNQRQNVSNILDAVKRIVIVFEQFQTTL